MRGDQRAGIGELLGAGGGREARRDGIAQAAAAAPSGDQCLGVGAAGGDGVAQALRPQVHQHLAGDDPHVALERGFEERVDRAGVDGGEDERAGGAVAEQLVEEEGGHRVGVAAVGEGLFGREDMAFEPLHELFAVRGDALDLRIMDMGIDEAGDDQAVQPLDLGLGERLGEIGIAAAGEDEAVLDDEQAVLEMADRLGARDAGSSGTLRISPRNAFMAGSSASAAARAWRSRSPPAPGRSMPGRPIGQVRRAASTPSAARRERKRARLVCEPISPTKRAPLPSAAAVRR